jgi:hypothetical protein
MNQQLLTGLRFAAVLSASLIAQGLYAEDLHIYNHTASIPAWSDPSSIRLEKIRLVKVPATLKNTTDQNYCGQLAFRDPGGSMFCPDARTVTTAPMYEVTYSYLGQPLASDESSNRRFTFHVYFRPDELTPDQKSSLTVKTERETVRHTTIDSARSKFCDGGYVDGAWVHTQPGCKDVVQYTMTNAPADYLTVRVDPATSAARARQSASSAR